MERYIEAPSSEPWAAPSSPASTSPFRTDASAQNRFVGETSKSVGQGTEDGNPFARLAILRPLPLRSTRLHAAAAASDSADHAQGGILPLRPARDSGGKMEAVLMET